MFSYSGSNYFKLVLGLLVFLTKNEIEHGKIKNRKIDVTSFKLISKKLSNEKKNHEKVSQDDN